jgi:glycosyltransferase involved in cell wall biosynthesis
VLVTSAPRVLMIVDASLEGGRGPMFRILGILPHLVGRIDLRLVTLGEPTPEIAAELDALRLPWTATPLELDGWTVTTAEIVAARVEDALVSWPAELVLLSWEIWDLVERLAMVCRAHAVPFAVALHAIPLLNAPANPSCDYQRDLDTRLQQIRSPRIREYIARKRDVVPRILPEIGVVAVNRTVDWMLRRYFPGVDAVVIDPAYALDPRALPEPHARRPTFDAAFMAKLVPDKGIFDLLDAVSSIHARNDAFRCLAIGSFDDDDTRAAFGARRRELGLDDVVVCAGWLEGRAKYEALASARVFLYPSVGTDTFSICVLEALAVGLPVVCYDAPYVRNSYGAAPMTIAPAGCVDELAHAAASLLADPHELARRSRLATAFARRHLDWRQVADSELAAYSRLVDRARGER